MTPLALQFFGHVPEGHRILEVGPSYNPMFSKSSGRPVSVLDHATRDELIAKYSNDPGADHTRIEEVDFVWRRGPMSEALPPCERGTFDIMVASHVVEHTPDLVSFLVSAQEILRPSGRFLLVVPDKRFCFDYFRPPSTTGDVLNAHLACRSRHTPGTIFDQLAYSVSTDGRVAWSQEPMGVLKLEHDLATTRTQLTPPGEEAPYTDAHNWRFTPAWFQLIILELAWLGLADWRADRVGETHHCEFPVQLSRGGTAWARSFAPHQLQEMRLGLLRATLLEQRAQVDWWLAGNPSCGLLPSQGHEMRTSG